MTSKGRGVYFNSKVVGKGKFICNRSPGL